MCCLRGSGDPPPSPPPVPPCATCLSCESRSPKSSPRCTCRSADARRRSAGGGALGRAPSTLGTRPRRSVGGGVAPSGRAGRSGELAALAPLWRALAAVLAAEAAAAAAADATRTSARREAISALSSAWSRVSTPCCCSAMDVCAGACGLGAERARVALARTLASSPRISASTSMQRVASACILVSCASSSVRMPLARCRSARSAASTARSTSAAVRRANDVESARSSFENSARSSSICSPISARSSSSPSAWCAPPPQLGAACPRLGEATRSEARRRNDPSGGRLSRMLEMRSITESATPASRCSELMTVFKSRSPPS